MLGFCQVPAKNGRSNKSLEADVRRSEILIEETHLEDAPPSSPPKSRPHPYSPVPFEDRSLLAALKLILGGIVLLALGSSLVVLFFVVGQVIDGNNDPVTIRGLITGVTLSTFLAVLLYLLGRKSRGEREALAGNLAAKKFARRKLAFQLSTFVLVGIAVGGIIVAIKLPHAGPLFGILMTVIVTGSYLVLGHLLWRCPGCGYGISFLWRHRDSQAIKNCPACRVRLQ